MGIFGDFVKEKRIEKGYSQMELATRIGLSIYQHISNLERGVNKCSPAMALRIAKALNITKKEIKEVYIADVVEKVEKEFSI